MWSATGIQWVEARAAVKQPTVPRTLPLQGMILAPNVRRAEVEKPCSRQMEISLSSLYWLVDSQMPFKSEANTRTFFEMSFPLQI